MKKSNMIEADLIKQNNFLQGTIRNKPVMHFITCFWVKNTEKINKSNKSCKKLQSEVDKLKKKVRSLESKMDVTNKANKMLKQEINGKTWTTIDKSVQTDLGQLMVDSVPISPANYSTKEDLVKFWIKV